MLKSCLRYFRKKAKLTQDELAHIVNVRRETIGRLETGQYNPSLELALRIARAVDTNIENIFILDE